MCEDDFSRSTLAVEDQVVAVEGAFSRLHRHQERVHLCTEGDLRIEIIESARLMIEKLAKHFSIIYRYSEIPHISIFPGKSHPIHEVIFDTAANVAMSMEPGIVLPQKVVFSSYQNQRLYLDRLTALDDGSGDPWEEISRMREEGNVVEIHEDHSRNGFKYLRLFNALREGRYDILFVYSVPNYPYTYWYPGLYFGSRDYTFNGFMASLSQIWSESVFFELHGEPQVFDHLGNLVTSDIDERYQAVLEVAKKGMVFLEAVLGRFI